MFQSTPRNETHAVIDRAARRGDAALQAGTDAAHQALDSIGDSARRLQADAAALGQRGLESLRDGSRALRDRAQVTGERTVDFIRDEPVKSVLLAAAAGAALGAVVGLFGGARSSR